MVELRARRLRQQPARDRGAPGRRRGPYDGPRRLIALARHSEESPPPARSSRRSRAPARRPDPRPPEGEDRDDRVDESRAPRSPRATRRHSSRTTPAVDTAAQAAARDPPDAAPRRSTSTLDTGELAAPIGTIDHLADVVLALAGALRRPDGRDARSSPPSDPEPADHARRPRGRARRARRRRRPVRAVIRARSSPPTTTRSARSHLAAFAPSDARGPDRRRPARRRRPRAGALPRRVDDTTIVGHVMLSHAHVDEHPALGLGPIAVDPAHQHHGIGGALMREVIERAQPHRVPADRAARPPDVLPALRLPPGRRARHHDHLRQRRPRPGWCSRSPRYSRDVRGTFRYAAHSPEHLRG